MDKIQNYTYHCHTDFSDGKNSICEMILRAKQMGFTEIGISDHIIVHKNIFQSTTWPYMEKNGYIHVYNRDFTEILECAKNHCAQIRKIAAKENFKVMIGFEVDFFTYSGWLEEFKWFISQLDVDYLHTGNHFFFDEECENVFNMTYLKKVCSDKGMYLDYTARHFRVLRQAIETGIFKFLAHLDYVRKYGDEIYNVNLFTEEKQAILEALKKTNTGIEISTKGLRKIGCFYPDGKVLEQVKLLNIPVVISDDAHTIYELGADFDKAEAELKKYNIINRLKF